MTEQSGLSEPEGREPAERPISVEGPVSGIPKSKHANDAAARYEKLHAILDAARALSGTERDACLEKHCAGEHELRAEVEQLLGALEAGTKDLFDESRIDSWRGSLEDAVEEASTSNTTEKAWIPERVGPYRIVRHMADGGMGAVYEAEQDSPRRRIALKVVHPLFVTPMRLKRFRQEAELLGRLRHPGIAQIHEAGSYDLGHGPQPYFAMELVQGNQLHLHAEEAALDLNACLRLLVQVCEAVHHAHQMGVIHRDLKPENILVEPQGQPKVLDFGIARATEGSSVLTTLVTEEGDLMGTIAYMAPEQLEGKPDLITARSDVYALGVITFELLAGRLPHDILGLPLPVAIQLLRERDPVRLGALAPAAKGDVETIVGKALEKEPGRRYSSAEALAEDLRAYLESRPIEARPPSRLYRAVKFTRRNTAVVAGVTATMTAILVGLLFTLMYAFRAAESEELATAGRRRAEAQVRQTVMDLLETGETWKAARSYRGIAEAPRGWETDIVARVLPNVLPASLGTKFIRWVDDRHLACELNDPRGLTEIECDTWRATGRFHRRDNFFLPVHDTHGRRWSLEHDRGARMVIIRRDDVEMARLEGLEVSGTLYPSPTNEYLLERVKPQGNFVLRDLPSGEVLHELEGLIRGSCGYVLWFAHGREFLTYDSGGRLVRVDVESFEIVRRYDNIQGPSCSYGDLSLDGRYFAFAPQRKPVVVFDLESGESVYEERVELLQNGGHRVHFSPDGSRLLVRGDDSGFCLLDWSPEEVRRRLALGESDPRATTFTGHGHFVYEHCLSPGDGIVASVSIVENAVHLWDSWTGEALLSLPKPKAANPTLQNRGQLMAFSADGRRLLVTARAGHERPRLLEWDLLAGEETRQAPTNATSPTSHIAWIDRFLEVLGPSPPERIGRQTLVLSSERALVAQLIANQRVEAGSRWDEVPYLNEYHGLAISPDEKLMALACARTVRLKERATNHTIQNFPGHAFAVDWSPDGRLIAAGGDGGRVRLIDPELGMEVLNFRAHDKYIFSLSWTSDGKRLVTASGDATVKVWDPRPRGERDADLRAHREELEGLSKLTRDELVGSFDRSTDARERDALLITLLKKRRDSAPEVSEARVPD